jgi:8-oxo-dGTP pyrophosphatase MutT (NUDIX family)
VLRHFTASGVVLSGDGHVLLVEHRKLGWWLYPGGHIEPNEDPAQAVVREVAEETGIRGQIVAETRFRHPAATVLPAVIEAAAQYARALG